MKIIQGVHGLGPQTVTGPSANASLRRSVLTIGNFDGVHLGHRALINRVLERAKRTGSTPIVMTFEPHPVKVLYPDRGLKRLFDFDDQKRELEALGVEVLVVEPFSREFSQLTPDAYIRDWILKPFSPELVVVGWDFTFGANKSGTIELLQSKASQLGFEVAVVPPVKIGDTVVSSSRIRRAIADDGDPKLAAELLGRPFYLRGLVERGAGRGRTIGVPTANVRTTSETIPAPGVYAAWAAVEGGRWPAAVNIGRNPTFQDPGAAPLSIEAHLIGFSADIYGSTLSLEFAGRLREERRFSSADELVLQIRSDVAAAVATLTPGSR